MAISFLGCLLCGIKSSMVTLISNNTLFIMCVHLFFRPVISKVLPISNEFIGIGIGIGVFLMCCILVMLCEKAKIGEKMQIMLGLKLKK